MIVVMLGAPGAGKGTQGDLLAQRCGYRKISTGDALRSQVKQGTTMGREAQGYMDQGHLVPDEVLLRILEAELGMKGDEVVLLDGYPRNIAQAKALEAMEGPHKVVGVIHLDVDREALLARISGRRICPSCGASYHMSHSPPRVADTCDRCQARGLAQRPDDTPERVAVRLQVYDEATRPVIDFYRAKGMYGRLDGNRTPEQIFADLKSTVASWVQ